MRQLLDFSTYNLKIHIVFYNSKRRRQMIGMHGASWQLQASRSGGHRGLNPNEGLVRLDGFLVKSHTFAEIVYRKDD